MDPTVTTIVDLYRSIHQKFRDIVQGMDREQVNWSPGHDLNSVAVIVTHTLGSELDTLLFVRGLTGDRDRESEFQSTSASGAELIEAIDLADTLLREHGQSITEERLASTLTRPDRDPQIGLHWLINNYGHAREHLGHLDMTRQLYQHRT